jgi:hypothetical protein
MLDQAVIGSLMPQQRVKGPRLMSVDITTSIEGTAIPRVFGRSRMAGQMIWATRFEEEIVKKQYVYFANFAVALAEGPVTRIGRIWLDGRELDQTQATVRTYLGTEDQEADSLIVAKEGADNAPAYRGIAYVVFERLAIDTYSNRMPVMTAEVFRVVGDLEPLIKGVALIPGSTEFGYEPDEVTRKVAKGTYRAENRHTKVAASDLVASLDMLQDLAPSTGLVNLVAAWFGDDLRAGVCTIRPKVENSTKETHKDGSDFSWKVAGLTRSTAQVMTQIDGRPAYGGAPNDASLIACIQELKSRGFRVMFYPFIMMDIASDNVLPNPYSDHAGAAGQPPYPWRGRITISPAPGFAGSPDKTAAASDQVASFLGAATAAHFSSSSGTTVNYSGPAEWSYRRFILHMAKVCSLAGGVDLFCIGSEMVGLTRSRDGAASYPFVLGLIDLAAQVRIMLGAGTRIGYAADWSEYHSHRPDDGTGDVLFNLDPLWANSHVDFIGIDNYLPLADWRDGAEHLDYSSSGPTTTYDLDYLKKQYRRWGILRLVLSGCRRDRQRAVARAYCATPHPISSTVRRRPSTGCSVRRTYATGGSTPTMIAPAAVAQAVPPAGWHNPSPLSSLSSAARPSTRAPTSQTCSSTPRVRNRSCRIFRPVRATMPCRAPSSRLTSPTGTTTPTIRAPASMPGR